jgi:hypothetical protein
MSVLRVQTIKPTKIPGYGRGKSADGGIGHQPERLGRLVYPFIAKRGWNTVVGYRPQLATQRERLCHSRWCYLGATRLIAGS